MLQARSITVHERGEKHREAVRWCQEHIGTANEGRAETTDSANSRRSLAVLSAVQFDNPATRRQQEHIEDESLINLLEYTDDGVLIDFNGDPITMNAGIDSQGASCAARPFQNIYNYLDPNFAALLDEDSELEAQYDPENDISLANVMLQRAAAGECVSLGSTRPTLTSP